MLEFLFALFCESSLSTLLVFVAFFRCCGYISWQIAEVETGSTGLPMSVCLLVGPSVSVFAGVFVSLSVCFCLHL